MPISDAHKQIWNIPTPNRAAAQVISDVLGVSFLTAQVLAARGGVNADAASRLYGLEHDIAHSPWLLPDVDLAVDRLVTACQKQERLVVYGDFDADGQCATALVILALRRLGLCASYYIPHRLEEGYGLNSQAVQDLSDAGYTLMITVDCGTNSLSEVALAKAAGMDCIVTDHHEPEANMAQPLALINPKLARATYPWSQLAGVGVAYKLMRALNEKMGAPHDMSDLLDLVAVGTVADIVPLQDENRYLVGLGMQKLNNDPLPGLAALAQVAGTPSGRIDSYHIGFQMAPRLNAAGRIADAAIGVEMLLSDNLADAYPAAEELDSANRQRQSVEKQVLSEARQMVEAMEDAPVIVVAKEGWHQGVVGIVASRLVDMYARPAIVLAQEGEAATGSGRSVSGFNMIDALQDCADILVRYGGHAMAAGMTINVADIPELQTRLSAAAEKQLADKPVSRQIDIDCCVDDLAQLNMDLLAELNRLGPFGYGNPQPVFASFNVQPCEVRLVGQEQNHLRLVLPHGRRRISSIGFRMAALAPKATDQIDIAYQLRCNEWNGYQDLQLHLQDIRSTTVTEEVAAALDEVSNVSCIDARGYMTTSADYILSILQRGLVPLIWTTEAAAANKLVQQVELAGGDANRLCMCWPECDTHYTPASFVSPVALVLCAPPVGSSWLALVESLTTIAEVHVLYGQKELQWARQLIARDWPRRAEMVRVYRYMQKAGVEQAGVSLPQVATACKLSITGARLAMQVLQQLQLAQETKGWHLLPHPGLKLDLAESLSYNDCITKRKQAEAILVPDLNCSAIWHLASSGIPAHALALAGREEAT